jgi:hypothetical protein
MNCEDQYLFSCSYTVDQSPFRNVDLDDLISEQV